MPLRGAMKRYQPSGLAAERPQVAEPSFVKPAVEPVTLPSRMGEAVSQKLDWARAAGVARARTNRRITLRMGCSGAGLPVNGPGLRGGSLSHRDAAPKNRVPDRAEFPHQRMRAATDTPWRRPLETPG